MLWPGVCMPVFAFTYVVLAQLAYNKEHVPCRLLSACIDVLQK
jgi:hypothetical protein